MFRAISLHSVYSQPGYNGLHNALLARKKLSLFVGQWHKDERHQWCSANILNTTLNALMILISDFLLIWISGIPVQLFSIFPVSKVLGWS